MGDDSQLQLEAPHITTQPLIIENSEEQWHSVTHYLMLHRRAGLSTQIITGSAHL